MPLTPSPAALVSASAALAWAVEWLRLCLEAGGALTIAAGTVAAIVRGVRSSRAAHRACFTEMRFELSRYLALALELQLAADILETATDPEWSKIGQLAAIAAIRTALNYFLSRELTQERREVRSPAAT